MPKLPSIEEILKEINRLNDEKVDGFTTRDLMDYTGKPEKWCQHKIRELIKSNFLEYAGRVNVPTIDNRMCGVPAYRIIDKDRKI